MRSNITVRSNVFLRQETALKSDLSFIRQVRGRSALIKLLKLISVEARAHTARYLLTPRQVAELTWEIPCALCKAFPEGAIRSGSAETVVFRCPRGRCGAPVLRAKTVQIPLSLVKLLGDKFRQPIWTIAQAALDLDRVSTTMGKHEPKVPIVLKLSPTQYHLYDDEQIVSALCAFVESQ
jgi:hypothetical protein